MSPEGPLQLLAILPLSLAAGIDLYLTLIFLGTASRLGWDAPAPGELADLAVPWILALAALLYLAERWMERAPLRSLFWNAAHTVIRPLAGALLAVMALADLPQTSQWAGAVAAAALSLAAHVTRSGWGVLLALMPSPRRVRFLASIAEDAGVLALLSLFLDVPLAAAALAAVVTFFGVRWGRSAAAAFHFALRLLGDSARALLRHRRWRGPERFPRWIRTALENPAVAPTGGLRGCPAAALNLPGLGVFRGGWVIARGGSPVFLYRDRKRATHAVDLGSRTATEVSPAVLHTRVSLGEREGRRCALYVSLDGPEPDDLRAEFQM